MFTYFFRVAGVIQACSLLAGLGFAPGAAMGETLEDAVKAAISNHPMVESAKANMSAAQQGVAEQYSGYYPELSVNATGGRTYADNSTTRGLSVTRGAGYSYLWEGSVTARQNLYDADETDSRYASAKERRLSAQFNVDNVKEDLVLNTARAYIDLLRARNALAMLLDHEKTVDDYLSRIKTNVDEGGADEAEYQRARNIRLILDGLIIDYRGQMRTAEANYFEMVGYLPESGLVMPKVNRGLVPMDVRAAIAYALEHHPSLVAAEHTAQSAAYDVKAERSGLYPDLDAELSYLKTDKRDLIGGEVEDAKAVLRMNWNYELGGAQAARIERKAMELRDSQARRAQLQRQVERKIRLAYAQYDTALQKYNVETKRTELNETLFATNQAQFEGAVIKLLQLMQSHNQLFTARLDQANSKYRLLAAEFAILGSIGRLEDSFQLSYEEIQGENGSVSMIEEASLREAQTSKVKGRLLTGQ